MNLNNSVEFNKRDVYFAADVENRSIMELIKSINNIKETDLQIKHNLSDQFNNLKYNEKDITIHLMTYGGTVYPGFAGYDIISSINATVICYGPIMSAGILMMLGGKKRMCYPNTRFMIHDCANIAFGKSTEIKETLDEMEYFNKNLIDIICNNTKITKDMLNYYIEKKKDWYIDAKTALDFGLVHSIIGENPIYKSPKDF